MSIISTSQRYSFLWAANSALRITYLSLTEPFLSDDERFGVEGYSDNGENFQSLTIFDLIDLQDAVRLRIIIKKYPLIDGLNRDGRSPLQEASKLGFIEGVEIFLQHGANPNLVELHHGFTALHYAAMEGRHDVIQRLIAFGCCTYVVSTSTGRCPLHYAAQIGCESSTRALLANAQLGSGIKYADARLEILRTINLKDFDGHTPLHLGCIEGSVPVVKMLIQVSITSDDATCFTN